MRTYQDTRNRQLDELGQALLVLTSPGWYEALDGAPSHLLARSTAARLQVQEIRIRLGTAALEEIRVLLEDLEPEIEQAADRLRRARERLDDAVEFLDALADFLAVLTRVLA